jgi:hypothetical protein
MEQKHGREADRSILSSTDEPDLVRGWYRDWLASHGWLAESATPAAGETAVDSYVRSGEQFRLAIMDRTVLSLAQGIVLSEGQTIYELALRRRSQVSLRRRRVPIRRRPPARLAPPPPN